MLAAYRRALVRSSKSDHFVCLYTVKVLYNLQAILAIHIQKPWIQMILVPYGNLQTNELWSFSYYTLRSVLRICHGLTGKFPQIGETQGSNTKSVYVSFENRTSHYLLNLYHQQNLKIVKYI